MRVQMVYSTNPHTHHFIFQSGGGGVGGSIKLDSTEELKKTNR